MYLLEIGDDGLVKDDVTGDGWKAIKEFRQLVEKDGIEGLTIVALSTDYASPLAFYSDSDRFVRATEEVRGTGSRGRAKKTQLILSAIEKYDKLQFNTDLEHNRIIQNYKIRLIERIKAAMINESEEGEREVERLNKTLKNHEQANAEFYKKYDKKELVLAGAVTANGYSLSRIESELLTKKNSKFATEGKDIYNPNQLGLQ